MAINNAGDLANVLKVLRTEIGKKGTPGIWLEFYLIVADSGDKGVRSQKVQKELGMTQGVASRMTKLMSRYPDPKNHGRMIGQDIFISHQDDYHRAQQRVFLSAKGRSIYEKLKSYL